jgi:hypothetical protein
MANGISTLVGQTSQGYHNAYPIPPDNTVLSQASVQSLLEPFANNIAVLENQLVNIASTSYQPAVSELVSAYGGGFIIGDPSGTRSCPLISEFSLATGSWRLDTDPHLSGAFAGMKFSTSWVSGGYVPIQKAAVKYRVDVSLSLFGSAARSYGSSPGDLINGALFCVNSGSNVFTCWPGSAATPNTNFLSWQTIGQDINSPQQKATTLNFTTWVRADQTAGSVDTLVFYLAATKAYQTSGSIGFWQWPMSSASTVGVPPAILYATVTSY